MKTLLCGLILLGLYAVGLERVFAALDTMDNALRAAYGRAVPYQSHYPGVRRHGSR